jgi:hypothetical protein
LNLISVGLALELGVDRALGAVGKSLDEGDLGDRGVIHVLIKIFLFA